MLLYCKVQKNKIKYHKYKLFRSKLTISIQYSIIYHLSPNNKQKIQYKQLIMQVFRSSSS